MLSPQTKCISISIARWCSLLIKQATVHCQRLHKEAEVFGMWPYRLVFRLADFFCMRGRARSFDLVGFLFIMIRIWLLYYLIKTFNILDKTIINRNELFIAYIYWACTTCMCIQKKPAFSINTRWSGYSLTIGGLAHM